MELEALGCMKPTATEIQQPKLRPNRRLSGWYQSSGSNDRLHAVILGLRLGLTTISQSMLLRKFAVDLPCRFGSHAILGVATE